MLTASNRLWMEKAANKWFACTDRKVILKLKNLLGIWFGLMFIEWNIIITFLLYSVVVHGIEQRIRLAFLPYFQSAHPFFHHLSIYPFINPLSAQTGQYSVYCPICAFISEIYFRKIRVVDFILSAHQLRYWQSFTQAH